MLGDDPYIGIEPRYLVLKRQGYKVLISEKDLALDVHYSHVNNRFSIDLSLILSRLFHDAVCQMVSDRGVDVIIHQMESMVLVKVAYQKGNNEDMDLAWLDDMLKPYHGNVEVQDGERHCIMLMLQLPMEND